MANKHGLKFLQVEMLYCVLVLQLCLTLCDRMGM